MLSKRLWPCWIAELDLQNQRPPSWRYGLPPAPSAKSYSCIYPINWCWSCTEFSLFLLRVGVVFCGRQSPGGHNVIWGLHDALKVHNPKNTLLGFLGKNSNLLDLLLLLFWACLLIWCVWAPNSVLLVLFVSWKLVFFLCYVWLVMELVSLLLHVNKYKLVRCSLCFFFFSLVGLSLGKLTC